MFKVSTVVAFLTSMVVTTFFTAASCMGIYLYIALRGDIRRGRKLLRLDLQKDMFKDIKGIETVAGTTQQSAA